MEETNEENEKPQSLVLEKIAEINELLSRLDRILQPVLLEPLPVEKAKEEKVSSLLISELEAIIERLKEMIKRAGDL